ncbi:methyl-accepting chemotaxis protein [Heliomicrobium modesticaldum Ice1]|uniref:Methyl-accepting chemotaxis protein n=1 Tax=Heliobacterium modesticaldum (strain ATCC 51547 / Ice1) TaxID=498761 RepID=B0TG13_HELMI|nr:methyl-accepting chemotaxis protein [Heliomicrobium modesticaldum]ABZ83170.1 methyl-accepting chemotaxis protein [Heliomicrobium modesticaldum Ice1]
MEKGTDMQKSLLKKMVFFSLLITLVPVLISLALMYWQVRSEMIANQEQRLTEHLQNQVRLIETIFKETQNKGRIISQEGLIMEAVNGANQGASLQVSALSRFLQDVYRADQGLYENIFITGRNGLIYADAVGGSSIGTDVRSFDFFQPSIGGQSYVSQVIQSPITKRPVVVVSTPIRSHQGEAEPAGILAMAVEFNRIAQPIIESPIGQTGYNYITNEKGLVLAHPDSSKVWELDISKMTNGLEQIPAKAAQSAGTLTHPVDRDTYTTAYTAVPGLPLLLLSTIDQDEYASRFSNMLVLIAGVTMALVILAGTVATIYSKELVATIKQLRAAMAHGAAGNLTVRAKIKAKDEMAGLAKAFNIMVESQSQVVGAVRKSSDELAASSQELAASNAEINATISDMSKHMEQMARDAELGSQSIVQVSQVLVELASLIQIARQAALVVDEKSQLTLAQARKGKATVHETMVDMTNIQNRSQEIEGIITNLNEYTQQISSITDTITSIATQTNLLALNAAIEAARAGEHGRGFAVVADEVRKLAEQSTQGAAEVSAILEKVQSRTADAVQATQRSREDVQQGVAAVRHSGEVLEQILQAVELSSKEVARIVEITDEEVTSSDKILQLIDEVAKVIERTSQIATHMAASSEEAAATMENLAAASEQISAMAAQLSQSVRKFKTDAH